jgi:hypothetical protein
MGMDVYGRKPTGPRGKYFRNNIATWHPLARYCNLIAPDICGACKHWHTNDGDGLDDAGAVALADILEKEISAGWAAAYGAFEICQRKTKGGDGLHEVALLGEIARVAELAVRTQGVLPEGSAPLDVTFWGEPREPSDFVENVTAFIAFLRESGGFSIW